jgi:hypothetical protein
MGQTYVFECEKCKYHTKVSGGRAEGLEFTVQTIFCHNCREVRDAVTFAKVPLESPESVTPPSITQLINRLLLTGRVETRWQKYDLACVISPQHVVRPWKDPGACPKCGVYLERSAFPFRQWA